MLHLSALWWAAALAVVISAVLLAVILGMAIPVTI